MTSLESPPNVVPQASRDAVRAAILEAAITVHRARSFRDTTPAVVARQARLGLNELLEIFPTSDELLIATIEVWNERRMTLLGDIAASHGAVQFLRSVVVANLIDPGLMRLMTATLDIAATPSHPLAPQLRTDYIHFHASIQRLLIADIENGREPSTMQPAHGAEQLIAIYEGLQLQWMLRPQMNLLQSFDRAVTRLREGWSRSYIPPVWDLQSAIE